MSRRSVFRSRKCPKNCFVVPVSVVGLSSDGRDDISAVGKSSFCSRFVKPAYDDYEAVKGSLSSCISESDFAHPVINNAHFLYYPVVRHSLSFTGTSDVTFHVIEQTVFTNDATFRPFLGSGSYVDRATQRYIRSEGKLAYVSRDAIGDDSREEIEFPCQLFGRTGVKGFICVYDPTVKGLRKQDQEKMVCRLIKRIKSKVKVPVVLTVLKCDVLQIREPESQCNIAGAREIAKRFSIPLIFASAHKNVNVKETFFTLAKLVLGKKLNGVSQMSVEYQEAHQDHLHFSRQIEKDYGILLSSMVKNLHTTWSSLSPKLEGRTAYESFVHTFGKGQAKRVFQLRVLQIVLEECKMGLKVGDINPCDKKLRAEKQEALRDLLEEHEDFHEIGDLKYEFIAFAGDVRARSRSMEHDYDPEPVQRHHMSSKMTSTQSQVSALSEPNQEGSNGDSCEKQPGNCVSLDKSEEWPCSDEEHDYEEVEEDDKHHYENDKHHYENVDYVPMPVERLRVLSKKMTSTYTQSRISAALEPYKEGSNASSCKELPGDCSSVNKSEDWPCSDEEHDYEEVEEDDKHHYENVDYVPMPVERLRVLSKKMTSTYTQSRISAASEPYKEGNNANSCKEQPGDCSSVNKSEEWPCSDEEHIYEEVDADDRKLYENVEY